jgi:HD-GYP domain-containing protein (c-di-GMP phosphodiesterase class II)
MSKISRTGKVLLMLMISSMLVWASDHVYVHYQKQHELNALRSNVEKIARGLEFETMRGQAMGMATLLGLNEPLIKDVARGKLPMDAPEALARMRGTRQQLGADGLFIINADGIIVGHESTTEKSTGKDVKFRPYFQQAFAGKENIYAAAGTTGGVRGLYIAAPLRENDTPSGKIIGVVTIKMLAAFLDDKLKPFGSHGLLLTPQGVVFASTNPNWVFGLAGEATPGRIASIKNLRQFGKIFEQSDPARLPISLNQDYVVFADRTYAVATSEMQWEDPAGPWKVVILQDAAHWVPWAERLILAALIGFGSLLIGLLVVLRHEAKLRSLRYKQQLEESNCALEVLTHTLEDKVHERTRELTVSQGKLENLIQTGIELGSERDRMALLHKTLFAGKSLLNCDAGTLYLVTDHKTLKFALRTRVDELPAVEIPLYEKETGAPVERFVSTYTAIRNTPVLIDDIYQESRFDVSGTKRFDEETGYRTVSMLTVPLAPRDGEVIGVLQFMNALDPGSGVVTTFNPELVRFVTAMAAQASLALDNYQLIQAQKDLMDSFIKLIAGAIDAKSPYTGGHCERVPELAIMLAEEASRQEEGPLADFGFTSDDEWREFRIGAWLHDCGKVTTPEFVVDKASKLETIYNRIHEVRMRFEVLLRDAVIARLESIANGAKVAEADQAFDTRKAQLIDDFAFVAECNIGGEFMAPEKIDRLKRIAEETWMRNFDDRLGLAHGELQHYDSAPEPMPVREPLLSDKFHHVLPRKDFRAFDPKYGFKVNVPENLYNYGEIYNLSIGRGTLTEEERFKINEHIIQTIVMLDQLPLPKNMRRVSEYAGTHHETMIGTGYPRQLDKTGLSIPSRIMAIADIFEALTASDRPYKKAKTLSESIRILSFFKKDKHVDGDLFDLFLTSGVYRRYAEQFLLPEQIDEVDIKQYLA